MDKQDVEEKTQDAEDKTQDAEETCGICKKEFVDPVKLLCQHYFCQDCALKWMEKNANCARCGKPTRGILNAAREKKQQSRE